MRQGWVAGALLWAACASAGRRDTPAPNGAAEAAARLARAESAAKGDPARLAYAGWLRYLIASDLPEAEARLTQAAQSGPPQERALALAGLGEIAEDRLDTPAAVQSFIEAIRIAPQDPIAELAASRLLDLEGDSPQTDDPIAKAADALATPVAPRAARFLREAAARIATRRAQQVGDPALEIEAWRKVGAVQRWRIGGPFAALRLLDLSRQLPLDGPVTATSNQDDRVLDYPDGDVGLDGEPGEGDVYYGVSDVALEHGGYYLVWVEGAGALEVRLDGAVAMSRVPYPVESQRAQTAAVRLAPGKHRVLVRWSRAEGNRFRLVMARADGAPSDLSSAAPATLSGERAAALCDLGHPCVAEPAWKDAADLRAFAESMLEKDAGDPLAAYLRARATLNDDRITSRLAVAQVVAATNSGAAALALRAQLLLRDPEVPDRIGRARALADLDEATRKAPQLSRAHMTAAALDRDAERYEDAGRELDAVEALLRGAKRALPARVLVARARLLDARGNTAAARARVQEALRTSPGRCDAAQLALDLSRRGGAVAEQRRAAEAVRGCSDGLSSYGQALRDRGELAAAQEILQLAVALRPASPSRATQLSEVQAARKDLPGAVASIRRAMAISPRDPEPVRRLAGLFELEGNAKAAAQARRDALRLAPGDLALREQVALDAGERLLAWTDRDAVPLAKQRGGNVPAGASAVRLLDYGGVQMFADGGGVERVHTLVRVLDKKGVSRFGEAQVPGDARVLHLRTLKADGRVLEPESIPEKEGISLPGLEPGDSVEVDYLRGIARRGPDLPGFSLGSFYFRDEDVPMTESSYEVRAPAAFEIDAHNVRIPEGAVRRDGDQFVFRHAVRDVAPLRPEPHQPGEAELMPFVQVGAGARQEDLIRSYADWILLRARPTSASLELARRSVGRDARETAERIYDSVAQAVRGRSTTTDFASSAAHVLAQGRGNRLVVLKSALAAARIPSHIVLTRTFAMDQGPYRFPRAELTGYALLRIDLPAGAIWIDPTYRLAPFAQLPRYVRGQEAWVLPEPGEQPVRIETPEALPGEEEGRALALELTLSNDGSATGAGRDEHRGFEAASLKDALERLDRDQRKQAVESMLGRGLRGVSLQTVSAEHENDVGGIATLVYGLQVDLARRDGDQLLVQGSATPAKLTRLWAPQGERAVPLLIDSPEVLTTRMTVALPAGKHLRNPPKPVVINTAFGRYSLAAHEEGGKLVVEESLDVPQQRIAPAQYPAFAAFARAVDEAQAGELLIAP